MGFFCSLPLFSWLLPGVRFLLSSDGGDFLAEKGLFGLYVGFPFYPLRVDMSCLELETWLIEFFSVLESPSSEVEEFFLCWSMTIMCGLLGYSLLSLYEVALSLIEVEIWWLGVVGFLLSMRETLRPRFYLLSIPIKVYLFPIEVGRW